MLAEVTQHNIFCNSNEMSIAQTHEKIQDNIQKRLQDESVPEAIQDKLGSFALIVIQNDLATASEVCYRLKAFFE